MSDEMQAARVRELVDGDLADRNKWLDEHTGQVGAETSRALSFARSAWDRRDQEGEFASTAFGDLDPIQEAMRSSASARVSESVRVDAQAVRQFATGLVDEEVTAKHVQALKDFWRFVRYEGTILNLCGATNSGKTNVTMLTCDVADAMVPGARIITNIREEDARHSWSSYVHVDDIDRVEEELAERPDQLDVVVVDDSSIDHSEHAENSNEVARKQGRLARLAAKLTAVLIFVGHRDDGKDLVKHVRAMPGAFHLQCVRRLEDDDTVKDYIASVYESLDDDGGLSDHYRTLAELPEASADYDPDAIASNLFV